MKVDYFHNTGSEILLLWFGGVNPHPRLRIEAAGEVGWSGHVGGVRVDQVSEDLRLCCLRLPGSLFFWFPVAKRYGSRVTLVL